MASELLDVIVVGAGLSGIAAARFYLDTHPSSRLLILEKDSCVGGPWGKSRYYPGFWSQTGLRLSGFTDEPMTLPEDVALYHDIFEAKYVTEYLEKYVDSHVYDGTSLRERVVTGFGVTAIHKVEGVWVVEGALSSTTSIQQFKTEKLIIATGMTSTARMPKFDGQDQFGGQIIHQKDFGHFLSNGSPTQNRVAVIGGAKSAADAVYNLAKAGREVHWIIRKSGRGPAIFLYPAVKSEKPFMPRLLNDPEFIATRMFAAMSPECFRKPNLVSWFLHGTRLGNHLVTRFWNGCRNLCKRKGHFHDREGALDGFKELESNVDFFWLNGPIGLMQRPDFWDTVAQNVHVHRNDIERLEDHTLVLKDGPCLPVDVIVCATGWSNEYPFITSKQQQEFGLSHPKVDNADEAAWEQLEATADQKVIRRFPKLASPTIKVTTDPWLGRSPNRLYNCITPLDDHTIAFVGNASAQHTFRAADVQAAWTTALFDGVLKLPSREEMRKEVAWVNAFMKRRYPSIGAKGLILLHDYTGYLDHLMDQTGLKSHRKGWWDSLTLPMFTVDMKDSAKEYNEKYAREREDVKFETQQTDVGPQSANSK